MAKVKTKLSATLEDLTDQTKKLDINLGGATTATTTTLTVSQTVDRTLTLPNATDTLVGKATSDVLTNKTIDAEGTGNSITNLINVNIKAAAAIDASKIANGLVSSTEFQYLDGVTSAIQTQLDAKASTALTSGSILVGNVSNVATVTAMSGAVTIDNTGVTTYAGTVPLNKGGTGQVTKAPAFDALSPTSTAGDLTVRGASANVALPIGTDGQTLVVDTSQTNKLKWSTLPQGNKNYVTYNNFENNATTGWSLASSTITSLSPTSVATAGTAFSSVNGGSAANANLSFAAVSSGTLAGSYSGSLVASSATIAGNMLISQAYTIDKEDQAKAIAFKFYYSPTVNPTNANWSGTSSNTIQVWLYDVANAAWIQPAGVYNLVQSTGVGISTGTFQTPSNMTSFQIALISINASAGAITMLVDDFSVGPQITAAGAAMSDWQSYTPTFGAGFGTVTPSTFYSRRVGDSLEIYGKWTNGTVASSAATITVGYGGANANVTIDTTKLATSNIIGTAQTSLSSTTQFGVYPIAPTANATTFAFSAQNSSTGFGSLARNGDVIASSSSQNSVHVIVPIVGWSAQTVMSNDTNTRVIAARYAGTGGVTSYGASAVIKFTTLVFDKSASYNTSTGLYTVPVSGLYRVTVQFYGTTNFTFCYLGKNGSTTLSRMVQVSASGQSASILVEANAGDTLGIYNASASVTSIDGESFNSVSFELLSGPATIAATDTVAARYKTAAGQSLGNGASAIIDFGTKDYDRTAAVATGATWKFTCPVSGVYRINSALLYAAGGGWAAGEFVAIEATKNGTVTSTNLYYQIATHAQAVIALYSDTMSCLAGDYIQIRGYQNSGGSLALSANGDYNYVSIERIGN